LSAESQNDVRVAAAFWLGVLALFALVSLARLTLSSVGHDFYQFWSIGQSSSQDGLYAPATSRAAAEKALETVSGPDGSRRGRRAAAINRQLYASGIEPISTPAYYWAFSALPSGDYDTDLLVFQFVSTTALLWAAWLLFRRLGYTPIAAGLALTVLMLMFGPLHADIETANTNRLQLAWLAGAVALHHRSLRPTNRFAAGALLGLLIVLKPNFAAVPLLLAGVWTIDRRVAELRFAALGWISGAAVAIAIGSLAYSWESWGQWVSALAVYQQHPAPIARSNWSAARLIFEWTGTDVSVALAIASLVGVAVCAWRGRTGARPFERDVATLAIALLVVLIASQIAWDHYYLLAAPALVMSLRPGQSGWTRKAVASGALCACAITPLRVAWPEAGPLALAISGALGVVGLFVLSLLELSRPGGNRTQTPG